MCTLVRLDVVLRDGVTCLASGSGEMLHVAVGIVLPRYKRAWRGKR